jgi:hypothetical protein
MAAELKKTPMSSVNEDIISMEFDSNPNIPTANYSEETAIAMREAIAKKMKIEKLKKMIEKELKQDLPKTSEVENIGFSFSFNGM